jgi:hypothetical protein
VLQKMGGRDSGYPAADDGHTFPVTRRIHDE